MALAAFTVAALALGAAASGVCPGGLSGSGYVKGSSCYEFVANEMTWVSARSHCHSRGGRLAAVTSADIQKWISSQAATLFKGYQGVWIGLNDREKEGSFVWDNNNGMPVATSGYTNWNSGEPDDFLFGQDCVYMRRSYKWRWDDMDCSLPYFRSYNFICEYSAVPPTVSTTLSWSTTLAASSSTSLLTTVVPSTVNASSSSVTALKALTTGIPSSTIAARIRQVEIEQPSSTFSVTSEADTLPSQMATTEPTAASSSSADVGMSPRNDTRPISTTLVSSSTSIDSHLLTNAVTTESETSTRSTEATVSIHWQSTDSSERTRTTEPSSTTIYEARNASEANAADDETYLASTLQTNAATAQSEASTGSTETTVSIHWQPINNSERTRTSEPIRALVYEARNAIEVNAAADETHLASSTEPPGEPGARQVASQESTYDPDMPIYLSVIAITSLGAIAALAALGYKAYKRRQQQRPVGGIENPLY